MPERSPARRRPGAGRICRLSRTRRPRPHHMDLPTMRPDDVTGRRLTLTATPLTGQRWCVSPTPPTSPWWRAEFVPIDVRLIHPYQALTNRTESTMTTTQLIGFTAVRGISTLCGGFRRCAERRRPGRTPIRGAAGRFVTRQFRRASCSTSAASRFSMPVTAPARSLWFCS